MTASLVSVSVYRLPDHQIRVMGLVKATLSHLDIVYDTIHDMRAKEIVSNKTRYPDGSIMEIHIWQLPQATPDRPHGFKFRLNYSLPDGSTLVRYDNETGKGDHKHIKSVEMPYEFSTPEQVINDFRTDILKYGGQL